MTLDPSINNVGEYYSSHYLTSSFLKDVKKLITGWRKQGSASAPRRVQGLSRLYFKSKTRAMEEETPGDRPRDGWHSHLLESLGYTDIQALDIPVEGGKAFVPALGRIHRYNRPWLVICETVFLLPDAALKDGMPSEAPLEMTPLPPEHRDPGRPLCGGAWSRVIGRVFTEEEAPRWVILLAGSQALLLDKHTYAQGRYLSFDFDDAFGRVRRTTFDHIAAFLSAPTLCPDGESEELIHDKLEENSHKFAHGVTENLQWAVREAISELADEWVADRRRKKISYTRRKAEEILPGGSDEITAGDIQREALVFVYRLLFCFYAEARGGELDILPIGDEVFRLGYSLESLRDLEQTPLTAATEAGTYFHEHLKILFKIIHKGFNPIRAAEKEGENRLLDFQYRSKTFTVRPLTATLFDPAGAPLLDNARLSNRCLQNVIRHLSLSRDEKNKSIGRVNYAELGINQLGAVYEGLLSYKGMFAGEDLIQVKPPKGNFKDKKTPTWFVPAARLEAFRNEKEKNIVERVLGKPRIYKKGSFILHLSGMDRERSASFYTPEALTKCLVEEALRETLKDLTPEDADKILDLKICEPAMGSGAFLNEAAEQLAGRYLELKRKQIDQSIEPGRHRDELRRVKHYITTRNVYGVDLNPTAVELGALSLWLGSVHRLLVTKGENGEPDRHRSGATPWFGLRLRQGNSLIGARRAVWTDEQLRYKRHFGKYGEIPRLLKPGEPRKKGEIYHFLVFDPDMIPAQSDKLARQFWPERCGAAKHWLSKQVKKKWDQEEIAEASRICDLIDGHWKRYTRRRLAALEETACTSTVWPGPSGGEAALVGSPTLKAREKVLAELESASGAFQRLKLLMDAWCALWFWPLEEVGSLPDRKAFLAAASLLLGDRAPDPATRPLLSKNLGFEIDGLLAAAGGEAPDADLLSDVAPWFGQSRAVAAEERFHHWELVFAEVLGPAAPHPGFDLVVGNPPWLKVRWEAAPVLREFEPLLGVQSAKSAKIAASRTGLLENEENRAIYFDEFRRQSGAVTFMCGQRVYPALAGVQTNTYKNFMVLAWTLIGASGVGALVHEDGVYDDPKGGRLRAELYARLRGHLQFKNELKLFADVHDQKSFSLSVFGPKKEEISFLNVANLYSPATLAYCHGHDRPEDPVPGIKTAEGKWELRGHAHRIVQITEKELGLFASVFENNVASKEAKLPQIHSNEVLKALERFSMAPTKLSAKQSNWKAGVMFDETYAQRDGFITRVANPTHQPESLDDWVICGPHFYVGNAFQKTPFTRFNSRNDYADVDLCGIDEWFLPRSIYRSGDGKGDKSAFYQGITVWKRDVER
ncbi:MAG: SAM-dependent DNA methyltransferase, partial [Desulfobacterales bacterium]|nr:SAM-dependent DNA methyltransferase [Desulfobacterales bacterium]